MNEHIMRALGFNEAVDNYQNGLCPSCGQKINVYEFNDPVSYKEYQISGLCRTCQDDVFGGDESESNS